MITDTLPVTLRDRALGVISRRLGGAPDLERRLAELGNVVVVNLLLDLEAAFGIGIDPDEVLPDGTLGMLLAIVRLRGEGLLPHRPKPCPVYDFAAARARRARGEAGLTVPLITGMEGLYGLVDPPLTIECVFSPLDPPLQGEVSPQVTEGVSPRTPCPSTPSGLRPPPPGGEERAEVATPSDAAWDRALADQARERCGRQLMLMLGLSAAAGAFCAVVFWLAQLGVL